VRGTAVTRLALAGCATADIASIAGHSLRDVRSILGTSVRPILTFTDGADGLAGVRWGCLGMIRQKRVGPSPSEARLNKGWDRVRETPPHSNAGRSGAFLNTQADGRGFAHPPIERV